MLERLAVINTWIETMIFVRIYNIYCLQTIFKCFKYAIILRKIEIPLQWWLSGRSHQC